MSPLPQSDIGVSEELSPWEAAMLEVFVRAACLVGLPRSVGEIYGLLFCATNPMNFDQLAGRLGMSRGSVSQGLKLLRQLGAVKLHYIPSSRKDHYLPELSIKRLVRGFVKDQFSPHLDSGRARMDAIEVLIQAEESASIREHALKRVDTLRTWQHRMQRLLPLILAVLGGASVLTESDDADSDRKPI